MKKRPGEVRDAIVSVLREASAGASVAEIRNGVIGKLGDTPLSSIRSYLRLNTPSTFHRGERGHYQLRETVADYAVTPITEVFSKFSIGACTFVHADAIDWLKQQPPNSIHAVVTDPPYGLVEYTQSQLDKLRTGAGGVWRIPPAFDGNKRAPLPRFTVLTDKDIRELHAFFLRWALALKPILTPGANVVVASNPLLSYMISHALAAAGLERRGEIARLVMTMRGGDRPKAAHEEFDGVSVMPRSMWEPWLVFRKPIEGRVQDNLRKWGTGGFRRPSASRPFGDVIQSAPTQKKERALAPHPSLKPQAFLREVVRAALPLGKGIVLDTFAGSGSTLAAAEAVGYSAIGIEKDKDYFAMAKQAIPRLAAYTIDTRYRLDL